MPLPPPLPYAGVVGIGASSSPRRGGVAMRGGPARWLVAGCGGELKIWDVASHELVYSNECHDNDIRAIQLSPDGQLLITGSDDDVAKIWNFSTREVLHTLKHDNSVLSVAFSPDGRLFATGSHDDTGKIWEVGQEEPLHVVNHDNSVLSIAFSRDGQLLVTGSSDDTAKIWNVQTAECLHTLEHPNSVFGMSFSPSGRLLATADYNGNIHFWDVNTGEKIRSIDEAHSDCINGVAFQGEDLLWSWSDDEKIALWNADSGERVRERKLEDQQVQGGAVSGDGSLLATGSYEGLELFDAQSLEPSHTFLKDEGSVYAVTFAS